MEVSFGTSSFETPCDYGSIMTSSVNHLNIIFIITAYRHYICRMALLVVLRQCFECLNNFFLFILPNVDSLVPTDTNDMAYLLVFDVCGVVHAYKFGELILLNFEVSDFIISLTILSIYLLETFEHF